MRIFRLMRVESSLVGSVSTDSSRLSPSSGDDGSSFTIKSLRIIGTFTFLAFFQSRLTRVDLSFFLHAMIKFFLVDFFETAVAVWVRSLYGFCALSGLCVHIRILCSKRLVRTNTSFAL